jgi:hypothetical protein
MLEPSLRRYIIWIGQSSQVHGVFVDTVGEDSEEKWEWLEQLWRTRDHTTPKLPFHEPLQHNFLELFS